MKMVVLTDFGQHLFDYFAFRATVLNDTVQGHFIKKDSAEVEFNRLMAKLNPKCPLPMNKQKGAKKNYAFLTGMVNMLIEANISGVPCDYDPRSLTTMTHTMICHCEHSQGAWTAHFHPLLTL
jgi:hypothetical protein